MSGLVVPPDPRDNQFDRVLTREEEAVVAEMLYGFDTTVARRLAFQRWLRRYRTHETHTRDPRGLWYVPSSPTFGERY